MIYLVDGLLWVIAIALGLIAASRGRQVVRDSVKEGTMDCLRLIPRIMIGVIGSGYIAALLPQEVVGRWLGADSGVTGLVHRRARWRLHAGRAGDRLLHRCRGAEGRRGHTAGDRLHGGVGLFAFQRMFLWEIPVMPQRLVWLRVLASLPLPFLAAAGAMLIGRP